MRLTSRRFASFISILLAAPGLVTSIVGAQEVWINEVLTNPNGSDSTGSKEKEVRV